MRQRFKLFVRDLDRGENVLVLRTDEGHASGVAYMLDKLERQDIVGTLAGQDTILVIARTSQDAERLLDEFEDMLDV
ncbi:MAG: hypothetical protein R2880_09795 [Deinococcales bacterium]